MVKGLMAVIPREPGSPSSRFGLTPLPVLEQNLCGFVEVLSAHRTIDEQSANSNQWPGLIHREAHDGRMPLIQADSCSGRAITNQQFPHRTYRYGIQLHIFLSKPSYQTLRPLSQRTGNFYFEILFRNTSHATAWHAICALPHISKVNFAKWNMFYAVSHVTCISKQKFKIKIGNIKRAYQQRRAALLTCRVRRGQ